MNDNFSITLKKIRTQKKLTQFAICKKLSISQPAYSKLENGLIIPDTLTLFKISRILDIDLFYLLHLLYPNFISITNMFSNQKTLSKHTILSNYISHMNDQDLAYLITYADLLFNLNLNKSL